jgi:hypothetical protein
VLFVVNKNVKRLLDDYLCKGIAPSNTAGLAQQAGIFAKPVPDNFSP